MGLMLKRNLARLAFILYLGILVKVVLLRGISLAEFWELTVGSTVWRFIPRPMERVNGVPFETIRLYIDYYEVVTLELSLLNLLGNVLLFMPLGFLLKWLKNPPFSGLTVLVSGLVLSLLLEGLQYVSGTGVMDIDDVILNFLGVVIGLGLHHLLKRMGKFLWPGRKSEDPVQGLDWRN